MLRLLMQIPPRAQKVIRYVCSVLAQMPTVFAACGYLCKCGGSRWWLHLTQLLNLKDRKKRREKP